MCVVLKRGWGEGIGVCGFEEGMGGGGDRCVWREGGSKSIL